MQCTIENTPALSPKSNNPANARAVPLSVTEYHLLLIDTLTEGHHEFSDALQRLSITQSPWEPDRMSAVVLRHQMVDIATTSFSHSPNTKKPARSGPQKIWVLWGFLSRDHFLSTVAINFK